jgi:hypothetical protein
MYVADLEPNILLSERRRGRVDYILEALEIEGQAFALQPEAVRRTSSDWLYFCCCL